MSSKPALRVVESSGRPHFAAASASGSGWQLPPRGDSYLQIRISRNTLLAALLSLLIHALLLYFLGPQLLPGKPLAAPVKSLVVNLAAPAKATAPLQAQSQPPAETQPLPEPLPRIQPKQKKIRQPRPAPQMNHLPEMPKTLVVPEKKTPNDFKLPTKPPPAAAPEPGTAPPVDMMAYVNAARAKREASENYAARENAAAIAKDRQPTEEEVRTANIQRNLQQGTNGIFEILRKSEHSAQFSFKGWTNDFSNARREIITVEAGPNEDINRALVRRMIVLIRKDYSGDFNWESIRLNRVIILSARPEDNAGLEDFLLREFFGSSPGIPAR